MLFEVNDMTGFCPLITCQLTDRCGNVISPYAPDSIAYTVLPFPNGGKKGERCSAPVPIAIEGYVAVYSDEKRISPPVPFCILESIRLSCPKRGFLTFQVKNFHCCAVPLWCDKQTAIERIRLFISVETAAASKKTVNLMVPQVDSNLHVIDRVCIFTNMRCGSIRFHSGCCFCYKNAVLKAEVSHYNTIADGIKRTYRDSDERKEYGNLGILSPQEVSYYDVFVNGVLQPKTTYILKKGELTFTTHDVPTEGQPVMILFTTWKDMNGHIMNVTRWQYNAVSDGTMKLYSNNDEIKEYGNDGIPSPCEVSYFNLYINGVLQPEVNYCVRKGVLKLTTSDAPVRGAPVILESIVIRNSTGQLFKIGVSSYNTYSNGGKIYTNPDEIKMYSADGILDPTEISYQNLFVNGVLQPLVDYQVRKGYLVLETENNPTVGAPITLQSVSSIPAEPRCEVKMSDAALTQWEKVYSHCKDPCALKKASENKKDGKL